jgi:hypothetical protein
MCCVNSDFKCIKNKKPPVISLNGVVAMAETELAEKSEVTISASACKHSFGFLSQRAKGVAIPDGCFTCEKMLDCTTPKSEGTPVTEEIVETQPEEIAESKQELEPAEDAEEDFEEAAEEVAEVEEPTAELAKPEPEPVVSVEKIEEPPMEDKRKLGLNEVPKMIVKQVTKNFGKILKQRIPRLGVQVEAAEPTEKTFSESSGDNEFCVESAGTLYNLWSGTVVMSKETLESLGKKIKEVELETEKGRITICKAYGVPELFPRAIQVPNKIKATLQIEDGAHIKVKPILK